MNELINEALTIIKEFEDFHLSVKTHMNRVSIIESKIVNMEAFTIRDFMSNVENLAEATQTIAQDLVDLMGQQRRLLKWVEKVVDQLEER